MVSTILVVGATGNTGKAAVQTLSTLLEGKKNYRILGLTRSLENPAAKTLAALPNVEMKEKDWTSIDASWLREEQVTRAYVASHNLPHQFFDESALNVAFLAAGVQYIVRVSTAPTVMGPSSPVYYGRTHWAIEQQLDQPEFEGLEWTSLRPNLFATSCIFSAVQWIKQYKNTGAQDPLVLTVAADKPIGVIAPEDVGIVGAHLLASDNTAAHSRKRYILSGPEEVTGRDLVQAVEERVGAPVAKAVFGDTDSIKGLVHFGYPQETIPSLMAAMEILKSGASSAAKCPTSEEISHVAPKTTFREVMDSLL